jgi:glycosyltransferase involved in cell wall biosynthesis
MISLIIPCKICEESIEDTVAALFTYCSFRFPQSFEIIVVPNPIPTEASLAEFVEKFPPLQKLMKFAARHSEVKVVAHHGRPGKYGAIKTGLKHTTGNWIFFTDADLPFELSFFDEAVQKLRVGYDLVVGNRRHSDSSIRAPIRLLKRALIRDRIGRLFNFGVRTFFPAISARDTQAGIKAMSRKFAIHAFQLQVCPGFYGDIELFLVAIAHSYSVFSLPVIFNYGDNRSTIRFSQEFFKAVAWLVKIFLRNAFGAYSLSLDLATLSEQGSENHSHNTKTAEEI